MSISEAQNDQQARDFADDIAFQELTKDIPQEVLRQIEEQCEQRWIDELKRYAESAEERVLLAHEEMVRWRWLSVSLAKKANIPDLIKTKLMIPHDEPFTEIEQQQFEAMLEKMELYLKMGQDFETLLTAVNSNDAVQSAWDRMLVMMKLSGLDE